MASTFWKNLPDTSTPLNANNLNGIIDIVYPIGSIYMSVNSTNPGTLFGGTWQRWGNGRVPVGVDTSQSEFNSVEKQGGEKTHTLTDEELPTHDHAIFFPNNGGEDHAAIAEVAPSEIKRTWKAEMTRTGAVGGGKEHNILQPYITCYMWKRTA